MNTNQSNVHVMTKEEFVKRVMADLTKRKKERKDIRLKKHTQMKVYIINQIMFNRRKLNRGVN